MIPFSSERKAMGVVVVKLGGGWWRLYLKGASERWQRNALNMLLLARTLMHIAVTMRKSRPLRLTTWRVTIFHGPSSSMRNRLFEQLLYAIGISTLGLHTGWIHQPMTRFVFHSNLSCIANIVIFQVSYSSLAFDLKLIGTTGIKDPRHDGQQLSIWQEAEYVRKPQARLVIHYYDTHWYVACTASLAIWFSFTIRQKSLCKLWSFSSMVLPSKLHALAAVNGAYHLPLVSYPLECSSMIHVIRCPPMAACIASQSKVRVLRNLRALTIGDRDCSSEMVSELRQISIEFTDHNGST